MCGGTKDSIIQIFLEKDDEIVERGLYAIERQVFAPQTEGWKRLTEEFGKEDKFYREFKEKHPYLFTNQRLTSPIIVANNSGTHKITNTEATKEETIKVEVVTVQPAIVVPPLIDGIDLPEAPPEDSSAMKRLEELGV